MKRVVLSLISLAVLSTSVSAIASASRPINLGELSEQSAIDVTAAAATPMAMPPEADAPASLAAAAGQFVTVEQDHATTGTARIVTENGQRYLEFDAAFDTARGPDVNVVLYEGDTIPVNLTEGDYITLAPLQSFTGAQRYLIPADINLEDYQTVGIWCREFNVTFGYAPI